jgi:hypothetical protein
MLLHQASMLKQRHDLRRAEPRCLPGRQGNHISVWLQLHACGTSLDRQRQPIIMLKAAAELVLACMPTWAVRLANWHAALLGFEEIHFALHCCSSHYTLSNGWLPHAASLRHGNNLNRHLA